LTVLAAGFGVPEEMAGIGRGSTEATAKVRLQAFERTARAEQRKMADQFIEQIARPVLKRYSPFPHDIHLDMVFEDVVSDQTATAEWLAAFADYYTVNEIREKLGDQPLSGVELRDAQERVEDRGSGYGSGVDVGYGSGSGESESGQEDLDFRLHAREAGN
jgi:hypothetical protein